MATYTSNYAWTKPSGGDPVDIEVLNDNLDDQDSIVHQAFLDLAPVFSTSNTYAVKDVVLYDNKVWICHTAVTTAGAWTGSANWTQTTVGETGGVATYADLPDKPSINGNQLSGNKTGAQLGLQNALTFDNVPTANSNNPVKSGGVYSADEAIRKWTTAEAKSVSGNPITLTDGSARNAEGLSVTCNPKQNLHGYDYPWAGGAGKNKLPMTVASIKAANTAGLWNGNVYTRNGVTFTIQTDNDDNVIGIVVNGTASGGDSVFIAYNDTTGIIPTGEYKVNGLTSGSSSTVFMQYSYFKANSQESVWAMVYTTDVTASIPSDYNGSSKCYIIVKSGYNAQNVAIKPMIRLSTVSDATFEPYSNICPITGYTECEVDRDSKNLLPMVLADIKTLNTTGTWSGNAYTQNDVTFTVQTDDDGNVTGIKANGTASATATLLLIMGGSLSDYEGKIASCVGVATDETLAIQYYTDLQFERSYLIENPAEQYTIQNIGNIINVFIRISSGKVVSNTSFYPMIRLASVSDANFVPYSHAQATITFGQTVYGGSVDFKTGKVTVTHKYGEYDGDENWQSGTSVGTNFRMECNILDIVLTGQVNGISNELEYVNNYVLDEPHFYIYNGKLYVFLPASNETEFRAWLASNPLQICCPLATPIELTLTPAELELLKGYNYITTNGTIIALAYLPDSLLAEAENYVDAKIPPAPTTDGTYVLTCTVTSGTPVYSWESAT